MLLTHVIWQTDLKPLSVTNAKNGALPLSLTPTIHARCDKVSEWVGGSFPVRSSRSADQLQAICGQLLNKLLSRHRAFDSAVAPVVQHRPRIARPAVSQVASDRASAEAATSQHPESVR